MKSYWYEQSAVALNEALDKLPKDADKAAIKKAAADAYPFGQRAMWPYKKWLQAQRDILAIRYPRFFAKPSRPLARAALNLPPANAGPLFE